MNAEEAIYEVVIPMEDYVDFRNGKRVVAQRKMFPGLPPGAGRARRQRLVRHPQHPRRDRLRRPGRQALAAAPARRRGVPRAQGRGREEQVAARAKPRLEYEIGETVRVKEGPFADFSGEVIELNEDQLKLKVLVNIFGRETPVELEFSKVAKL